MSYVTLQLSRENDVVSDIIAGWTHSWPSHVDVVMPDGSLLGARSDVCANIPAGVQTRPAGYAPFVRTELMHFSCGPEQEAAFYRFLKAQIGKPYDIPAVVGLALNRDWRNDYSWFCSELVVAALEISTIIRKITSPITFISPRDILLLGETMGISP